MKVDLDNATLYLGDCREIAPHLQGIDAVVTDPPYGMKWDTDSTRFSGGQFGHRNDLRGEGRPDWGSIASDDQPFDPTIWLGFPQVVLFGCNHFARSLPVGTTLVWIKRFDTAFGSFLSDAELAWKKGGHGVYCKRDMSLCNAAGQRNHPTEKPVSLMAWCIQGLKGDPQTILDPYMGSGTTGVACASLGRRFIGIEREQKYFDVACERIKAAQDQGRLFA